MTTRETASDRAVEILEPELEIDHDQCDRDEHLRRRESGEDCASCADCGLFPPETNGLCGQCLDRARLAFGASCPVEHPRFGRCIETGPHGSADRPHRYVGVISSERRMPGAS